MESFREGLLQMSVLLIAIVFFAIIFLLNWLGYVVRKRVHQRNPEKEIAFGAAEGSLMGLMALLLAFSFSMSATKYESGRQTTIDEATLLNTAYLRISLFEDSVRKSLLVDFRKFVDYRVSYFHSNDEAGNVNDILKKGNESFDALWNTNSALISDPRTKSLAVDLVPVLINMRNMVTVRESLRIATVPTLIVAVLLLLVFVASFLTGFGMKPGSRNPVLSLAFAIMTSIVLYLVMELGRPRQGYINLKNAEKEIVALRDRIPK